jgi:hypothetical protein
VTARLDFHPDVVARIGARRADEIAATLTYYTCPACQDVGDARAVATVAVLRDDGTLQSLAYAHASCSASKFVGTPTVETVIPPFHTLDVRAVGLPEYRGHLRPVLLVTTPHEVTVEDRNVWVEMLAADGLHRTDGLGRPPLRAEGWAVRIGPGDALDIRGPRTHLVYGGQVHVPDAWRTLAREQDGAQLVVGWLGHAVVVETPPPLAHVAEALRERRAVTGHIDVHGPDLRPGRR